MNTLLIDDSGDLRSEQALCGASGAIGARGRTRSQGKDDEAQSSGGQVAFKDRIRVGEFQDIAIVPRQALARIGPEMDQARAAVHAARA